MAEKETKTIIVNPKVESEETIFPSLGLSNFEKQMKAFNSYSALNKFRDERGISPAFNYDTLGAYTAGNLLDLKNYGTSKFSVDFAGKITCVGIDAGTGITDSDLAQRTEGDGSGDKTITHSLGKTPSLIIIKANLEGGIGDVQDAWSYGYIKAVGSEKCVSYSQYEGGNYKTSDCIWLREASGDYWEGDVKSISTTDFVITFTKTGTPNACTFIWWAI